MTFMLTTLQHIIMLELVLYSFAAGVALAYAVWYIADLLG